MKKFTLLFAFACLAFTGVNAQATKVLNFGGLGTGLYASIEFPVSKTITIAPMANTDWEFNHLVIAAKGNFYFDDLFGLPTAWDVYGGANAGWRISDNGEFNWGAQVGGRWYWNDKWGINGEFGGGSGVTGGVGVTMKL